MNALFILLTYSIHSAAQVSLPVTSTRSIQAANCLTEKDIEKRCIKLKQDGGFFEYLENAPCERPVIEVLFLAEQFESKPLYRTVKIYPNQMNDVLDLGPISSFSVGKKIGNEMPYFSEVTDQEIADLVRENVGEIPADFGEKKWAIASIEGQGDGKMDFSSLGRNRMAAYYLYKGKLYNRMDFGNLVWAVAMKNLGFSYASIKAGSEVNGFFNTYKQNPSLQSEFKDDVLVKSHSANKLCWTGDSKADQKAIREGYNSDVKVDFKIGDCPKISYSKSFFSVVGYAMFGSGYADDSERAINARSLPGNNEQKSEIGVESEGLY